MFKANLDFLSLPIVLNSSFKENSYDSIAAEIGPNMGERAVYFQQTTWL